MTFSRAHLIDYNDHHVPTQPNIIVPPREQPGTSEPDAPADLIGLGEGFCNALPVLWKKIGMPVRDVPFPFLCQLNLALRVEPTRSGNAWLTAGG